MKVVISESESGQPIPERTNEFLLLLLLMEQPFNLCSYSRSVIFEPFVTLVVFILASASDSSISSLDWVRELKYILPLVFECSVVFGLSVCLVIGINKRELN